MSAAVLAEIVRAMEWALIERLPSGAFAMLAPAPRWLDGAFEGGPAGPHATLGAALPFLDYFLPQAEDAWYAGRDVDSGPFTATIDGEDVLLRARARTVAGRSVLVLDRLSGDADARPLLQTARTHQLDHETLVKHARAVHGPARAVAQAASALTARPPAEGDPALVALTRAVADLTRAVAILPAPPPRRGR